MRELAEILIKVLYEEVGVYKQLYEKLEEKTAILIEGDIRSLDNITKEEYKIIEKVSEFESLREKVIFNIAHKKDLEEDLSILEIAKVLEADQEEELLSLREDLLEVLDRIKNKNSLNSRLIRDSLDYIDLNIDLLTNRDKDLTYSKGSSKKENESIPLFNQKA